MKKEFNSKMEIVQCLVEEFGDQVSSYYNTPTNQQREKFWTFNRTLQHLFKMRKDYVKTEHGVMLKEFYENVYSKD